MAGCHFSSTGSSGGQRDPVRGAPGSEPARCLLARDDPSVGPGRAPDVQFAEAGERTAVWIASHNSRGLSGLANQASNPFGPNGMFSS